MAEKKRKYLLFTKDDERPNAEKPCAFFFSPAGCRNGEKCAFSHSDGSNKPVVATSTAAISSVKETISEVKVIKRSHSPEVIKEKKEKKEKKSRRESFVEESIISKQPVIITNNVEDQLNSQQDIFEAYKKTMQLEMEMQMKTQVFQMQMQMEQKQKQSLEAIQLEQKQKQNIESQKQFQLQMEQQQAQLLQSQLVQQKQEAFHKHKQELYEKNKAQKELQQKQLANQQKLKHQAQRKEKEALKNMTTPSTKVTPHNSNTDDDTRFLFNAVNSVLAGDLPSPPASEIMPNSSHMQYSPVHSREQTLSQNQPLPQQQLPPYQQQQGSVPTVYHTLPKSNPTSQLMHQISHNASHNMDNTSYSPAIEASNSYPFVPNDNVMKLLSTSGTDHATGKGMKKPDTSPSNPSLLLDGNVDYSNLPWESGVKQTSIHPRYLSIYSYINISIYLFSNKHQFILGFKKNM
jgi:hypothetical protein